jgi:hypothetical protein
MENKEEKLMAKSICNLVDTSWNVKINVGSLFFSTEPIYYD